MSASELRVICADGDEVDREDTVEALAEAGLAVDEATTVAAVADTLGPDVDCVVTGFELADGDAYDVVQAVRDSPVEVPVILFTDAAPSDLPRPTDPELVIEYLRKDVPNAEQRLVSLVTEAAMPAYQAAYPVPADEQERLAAVAAYDVPASEAADAFDRLTRLAVAHFDIDVAFVGLVDEHEERFVACEGANWETLAREDSICTHNILDSETMVVEDVREDPRFAANDRLEELNIRSYAGVRLTTVEGHAIGALCCIDDEPRSYTEAELADLRLFGEEATDQLRLRRRLNDRTEATR